MRLRSCSLLYAHLSLYVQGEPYQSFSKSAPRKRYLPSRLGSWKEMPISLTHTAHCAGADSILATMVVQTSPTVSPAGD